MNDAVSKFTKEEITNRIAGRHWYHKIELPHNIITDGDLPLAPFHIPRYNIPENLEGMRILDIRARDGFWSFHALSKGAKEVVAIDDFEGTPDGYDWGNFDFCKEALGYTDAQCSRHEMSVYDITEDHFGHFDIILFFDAFNHLRYPLMALDKLAAICDYSILVESAVCNDYSPYSHIDGYPGTQLVMEFYPEMELSADASNWWAPTATTLCQMLKGSGFSKNISAGLLTRNPHGPHESRGFIQAFKP